MKEDYYKKRINKNNVISFDIFDTLITRSVDVPTDIFELVGKKTNSANFKEIRINAERIARHNNINGEVTLDDIYEFIPDDLKRLKQIELDVELECAIPFVLMDEIYRYAVEEKEVYLISDMYLPKDHIKKMLEKCNLPLDKVKIYISYEYGVNKVSGKLFRKVLDENNIEHKSMIHFGDSLKADVLGAIKAGIKFGIVTKKNRLRRIFS